jgi:hypothetical protein
MQMQAAGAVPLNVALVLQVEQPLTPVALQLRHVIEQALHDATVEAG